MQLSETCRWQLRPLEIGVASQAAVYREHRRKTVSDPDPVAESQAR